MTLFWTRQCHSDLGVSAPGTRHGRCIDIHLSIAYAWLIFLTQNQWNFVGGVILPIRNRMNVSVYWILMCALSITASSFLVRLTWGTTWLVAIKLTIEKAPPPNATRFSLTPPSAVLLMHISLPLCDHYPLIRYSFGYYSLGANANSTLLGSR